MRSTYRCHCVFPQRLFYRSRCVQRSFHRYRCWFLQRCSYRSRLVQRSFHRFRCSFLHRFPYRSRFSSGCPTALVVFRGFSTATPCEKRSSHRNNTHVRSTAPFVVCQTQLRIRNCFVLHGSFAAPTMEPHRAKLRRLASIGVAQTKLLQIVDTLRDNPFDDDFAVSRYAFQGAFEELWAEAGCIIKLPTTSGEFEWECLSLPKALCTMVKHSHAFKTVLANLFQSAPCTADTPYNLVVYADEVCESAWGKQPPSWTAKVSRRRCTATLNAYRCTTAVGRLQHFPGGARKCSAARQ